MVEEAIETAAGGQEALAKDVGVSYGTLWAWAKGTRSPSPANRKKLAQVLRKRAAKLARLAERLDATVP
jgi:transcriptional regulator with XRE-family HTH domain